VIIGLMAVKLQQREFSMTYRISAAKHRRTNHRYEGGDACYPPPCSSVMARAALENQADRTAPYSTALRASSELVMPQILTRVRMIRP
jgi:hypothetical protein